MAAPSMKTLTDNQLTGELGETVVKSKILELGHVFEGRGRLETGIDGTIEFRDPVTRSMTGLTVAVQVKTTKSTKYVGESDDEFEYSVRQQDIDYWKRCSLPVALILYRQEDGSLYWRDVEAGEEGDERRLKFRKDRDRLDSSSIERLAAMAVRRGKDGTFLPSLRVGEQAHLNLMHVGLPSSIFVGESPFASGRDAVPELLRADGHHFDWVIRGRRFLSFRNPEGTPLEAIVDIDTVEEVDTEDVSISDDHDDAVMMIELLRRTMAEQFSDILAFDRKARLFYFKAEERYQQRRYFYRSLRETTSATVVQVYDYKKGKRKGQVNYLRHHAFSPRFQQIGSNWFLSISPTFVFTEDGFRPHRFASDLLAGKKRLDRNGSIRGQMMMFRFLLSGIDLQPHAKFDLFQEAEEVSPVLTFNVVEPVAMEAAVPENAWSETDPNAKRMKVQDDESTQGELGVGV
ncbi:hypothetical protein JI59_05330 [Novosphingobium pentaromativorans US6-1]|jgi:hypothetical protein|uniref:DUF4365 domain-containing protein n=2 Tax=Novosphingobium pentaromativorans TaxID=205844 RepID=G6EF19_9SPHN|nr:hypothetical protein JI59_05330 [Novosphingobium pentaromativorans US6-1]EHJ60072.1 hypothetical protein NSU_2940 [Novosphingobium pentaromativorans US6-1]